jgi:hypothetical protein
MSILLGAVKKEEAYRVFFYHKRREDTEFEDVVATNEKEAIKLATILHKEQYPRTVFKLFSVVRYVKNKKVEKYYM